MITLFVPLLPRDVLRHSGGPAKDRAEVAEATKELMAATSHALADLGAELPEYARARVSVLYLCGKRRRDGRFRQKNPNEAVAALRGVYQALVDMGVMPSMEAMDLGWHGIREPLPGEPERLVVSFEEAT